MSLLIERLGHRGEGVAEGPTFVAGALPGEVIEGEVEDGRIRKPRILTPSSDRVAAPCPHYRRCGGCVLQHASDTFVAGWKIDRVISALAAQGVEAKVRTLHTSPPRSRRRAVFSARRTKSAAEVGFHARASDQIVPVPECLVVTPAIRAALPTLEQITRHVGSRKGEVKITVTEVDAGLDLLIDEGKPLSPQELQEVGALARRVGARRVTAGDEALEFEPVRVSFDGIGVPLPPGAFLQATIEGEAALRAGVVEALRDAKGPVADLFAGCGTFALPLSRSREVYAVEGSTSLTAALDAGWRHSSGLRQVTTEARDLFRRPLLPDELSGFGGVVLDPPRAGAQAQVEQVADARVPRVAMVSCNPITFARDAARLLSSDYVLNWIDVVDQFRWSAHVELVAAFEIR